MKTDKKEKEEPSRIESIGKNVSFASMMAKVGFQVSIFVGILITLLYCGRIGYYPSGLTLGDSIFFLGASLAFAFVHSAFVYFLYCTGIVISPALRVLQNIVFKISVRGNSNENNTKPWITFPELKSQHIMEILVGLLFFIVILVVSSFDIEKGFFIFVSAIALGVVFGCWHTKPRIRDGNYKRGWQVKIILVAFSYSIPLFMAQLGGDFLNTTMTMIGVRSDGNNVLLTSRYESVLEYQNIKPIEVTERGDKIYENVLILFQGIGDKTVLKFDDFVLIAKSDELIVGKVRKLRN